MLLLVTLLVVTFLKTTVLPGLAHIILNKDMKKMQGEQAVVMWRAIQVGILIAPILAITIFILSIVKTFSPFGW